MLYIERYTSWFSTYGGGVSKFNGNIWTTYTTADGLSDNFVNSVAIDLLGNKWFGTKKGVSKFDGTTWKTYTTNDGLASNDVYSTAVGKDGNVWNGTLSGVSRFDGIRWTNYSSSEIFGSSTQSGVSSITIDETGSVWVGGEGRNCISKFNGVNWTYYKIPNTVVNDKVWSIAIDKKGNKWFGTNSGVCMFDGNSWYKFTNRTHGIVDDMVLSIAIDKNGNKWFGTPKGISRFNEMNMCFGPYYGASGTGNFNFIGSTTNGTGIFNSVTYTTGDGLADNHINAIEIDGDDNIWFATNNGISLLMTKEININSSFLNKSSSLINYPNPFNNATTIMFEIPKSSNVKMIVYNLLGQEIETLINSNLNAGYHEIKWDGSRCASGIYICRFEAGSYNKAIKLLLIK